jgi:hypothetical protein
MAGMRMASPLLALREGYSEAAVGVLLALYALTQVFLALPAGRYADRHGLKRPVASSVRPRTGRGLAVAFPVFPVLCVERAAHRRRHRRRVDRAAAARGPRRADADAAEAGVLLAGDRAGLLQLPRPVRGRPGDRPRRLSARPSS